MHKKETTLKHNQIANDLMNYINNHIDTDINIDQIALDADVSKFHLHRIFKEQMGANIYETIKSIRMQKSSNLLITNKYSTITQVAALCGYSSQTSFIRAFKIRFNQTPKQWRKGGYKEYSNKILSTSATVSISNADFSQIETKIILTKKIKGYYIRHKGYNRKARTTWSKLMAWVYTNKLDNYKQIAIYHDNPIITPLDQCNYVAAIIPQDGTTLKYATLPSFEIEEGICATFDYEGEYGDILTLIQWVYHQWLPESGFEATTTPSYTIFEKNHFLSDDSRFIVKYYVPVRYI
jgi:AraC family transcriptional regulator